jgi:predicted nucleic acid-binding protein
MSQEMEADHIVLRVYFLDASAIVRLVLPEPGSTIVRNIDKTVGTSLFTSWVLVAEALGVLKRKWLTRELGDDQYDQAVYHLLRYVERNRLQVLDLALVNGQPRLQTHRSILIDERRKYPDLDIADLLQFRVIKESFLDYLAEASPSRLVTADAKLARAAEAEGFEVLEVMTDTE